jgi:hypothetical protein
MPAQVRENVILLIIIILYEGRSENIWICADILQESTSKLREISSHTLVLEQHCTTKKP